MQISQIAPVQNRRPEKFQFIDFKKSPKEMIRFTAKSEKLAAEHYQSLQKVNAAGPWKPTTHSIDRHKIPEWFLDAKFGMFIDWGLWSVAGWAPKREKGAMYPDWYESQMDKDPLFVAYHHENWGEEFKRDDFIQLFTAENYQPEQLAMLAKAAGMKYIVPFCKHHGGYCLWPSSFTQRNSFAMGPQKDLIKPLVQSCQREGLKFGFYFSIEEWEYPVMGPDGEMQIRGWGSKFTPYHNDMDKKLTGKIPVHDFGTQYLVPQAKEFIDKYDPDLLWYDGDWDTDVEKLHTYEISAYFYNHAEGRKQVAVNDRCGGPAGKKDQRSERGDFFTTEYGDMDGEAKQTIHAWEECRGISQSFGYNWQDTDQNVISAKEFIDMFIDIVAHGGNLLLVVNLDGKGALPEIQAERLKEIGQWLKINGEGIYATRPFFPYSSDSIAYTQSKDQQFVYVILKDWPGQNLTLQNIQPLEHSVITMLGDDESIGWIQTESGICIQLDHFKRRKYGRHNYAWILKIKVSE